MVADKERVLSCITSLEDGDDERTALSKKISWILRRGARSVGIKIDDDGWVNVKDLQKAVILEDIDQKLLMQVVKESNSKKLRYEIKERKGKVWLKSSKAGRMTREGGKGKGKGN